MSKRKLRSRSSIASVSDDESETASQPYSSPPSKRPRLAIDSATSVPSPSDKSISSTGSIPNGSVPNGSVSNGSVSNGSVSNGSISSESINPLPLTSGTVAVTINEDSHDFQISQLSNIPWFRQKWTKDPQTPPQPESFQNIESVTMARFTKLLIFCNQPKDRFAIKRLGIPAQDLLPWLRTITHFGVNDLTLPMMEEFFDSYPAVPGIPHKVLTSWYQARIRTLPAVTKFATKKMTEIYQLFNLPNVERAKEIMNQFRTENCSILYNEDGSFTENVTRQKVEALHYELVINFCHFYQCLVWKDFHKLIVTVTKLIEDFNKFAESSPITDRFESFPFHEVLICILGWVRKLKLYGGQQTRNYMKELNEVLSLLPPLMDHYFCSAVAQRRWHEQIPWIAEHYFPKTFVREVESESDSEPTLKIKKKEKMEDEEDNDNDKGIGMIEDKESSNEHDKNKSNQKDSKQEDAVGTPDGNGDSNNGDGDGKGDKEEKEENEGNPDADKVGDPYFGSLGMELYKCIICEAMQFPQFVDYAVDKMLKPLLMYTFGRDEQWLEKRILTRINQKCALRIMSILYHEVILRFQQARGTDKQFVEAEYQNLIHTFSGLQPLKMFQSIFKHKEEHKKEESTE